MRRLSVIGLLVVASTASTPAFAAPSTTVDDWKASVTFSPIHLIISTGELTGEFKVNDKVGVGVIAGFGRPSGVSIGEFGMTGRYYLTGTFRGGVQIGAEALGIVGADAGVTAYGYSVGPFVGAKHIFDVGFTIDCQIGGQAIRAAASSGTTTVDESSFGVLLNLNFGWSF